MKKTVKFDPETGVDTPVIEFTIPRGKKFTFSPARNISKFPYHAGQEIDIIYNPESPEDAKINSFHEIWGAPLSILAFAAAITAIASILFISLGLPDEDAPIEDAGTLRYVDDILQSPPDKVAFFLQHRLLPGSFMGFGSISIITGIWIAVKRRLRIHWPTAEGIIIKSESGTSGKYNHREITYGFRVEKRKFEGHTIYRGKGRTGSPALPGKTAEQYPEGKKITVYYNPKNPHDCLLEPGLRAKGDISAFIAAGAAFLFVGLAIAMALRNGWIT